jgi:hypothetical protein
MYVYIHVVYMYVYYIYIYIYVATYVLQFYVVHALMYDSLFITP